MRMRRVKRGAGLLTVFLAAGLAESQTINNQTLKGKYFFRQVSLGTDAGGNLTDPRSILGTMTFDSAGNYAVVGQMVIGNTAATSTNINGTYSVDPAGFVKLASPLRAGETINARYGPEAIVGSSTESPSTSYDIFIAIPAPTAPASTGSLTGPYWVAT